MTLDHPVRSGLCHGPSCEQKITEKSQSDDFCSQACQARWQAAHVGVPIVYRVAGSGSCAPPVRPMPPERIEALRLDLSLGARHHLTGGEYVVTESEPGRAVLTPVRSPWWKPNTWRRNG